MPRVVFMCGPAGAGKSTTASQFERSGMVRLSFDQEAWSRGYRSMPLPDHSHRDIETHLRRRLIDLVGTGHDGERARHRVLDPLRLRLATTRRGEDPEGVHQRRDGHRRWLLEQDHVEDAFEGVEDQGQDGKPKELTVKQRFVVHVQRLRSFFSLVPASDAASRIRDDVAFFDAVRTAIAKIESAGRGATDAGAELDTAIRQIVSENMTGTGVVDIYAEAGIANPDISLIDEAFVKKVSESDRPNIQMEALKRLLNSEIRAIAKRNLVKGREFSEMLSASLLRYQNRSLDTAAVVAELVQLAQSLKAEQERGRETGLTDNELAFYDALRTNESAREAMQDEVMKKIAHDLTDIVRRDAKTDWNIKEQVRAKLRTTIKRLLLKHGYPPDKAPEATELILKQAETLREAAA